MFVIKVTKNPMTTHYNMVNMDEDTDWSYTALPTLSKYWIQMPSLKVTFPSDDLFNPNKSNSNYERTEEDSIAMFESCGMELKLDNMRTN